MSLRPLEIVCHRGANHRAPENTFASAAICLDWGVDYVEIDVSTSRDGVLYLFHGPQMEKTTDGAGYIGALDSAEIDRLDAGAWFHPDFAGERVPRLADFLRWIKGRSRLFLDVKHADARQLLDLLDATGMRDQVFVWSDFDDWMLKLTDLAPDVPLKVNVQTAADVTRAAERFNARIVEIGPDRLTPDLRRTCDELGLRVMVNYMADDPAMLNRLARSEMEMINTDHGDLWMDLRRQVNRGAERNERP